MPTQEVGEAGSGGDGKNPYRGVTAGRGYVGKRGGNGNGQYHGISLGEPLVSLRKQGGCRDVL